MSTSFISMQNLGMLDLRSRFIRTSLSAKAPYVGNVFYDLGPWRDQFAG